MSSKVDYVFAVAYQISLRTLRSQHHSDVFAIEDTIPTVCTTCFYSGVPKSRRQASWKNEFSTVMFNICLSSVCNFVSPLIHLKV